MRYAILESGGKQYRAVEGEHLDVDRLADEEGTQVALEHILLMADGDKFDIGTPRLDGVVVRATVVKHVRGPKVVHFRYSPKKRIRTRGGHRQEYTRLLVDHIGGKNETRAAAQTEAPAPSEKKGVRAEKEAGRKKAPSKKAGAKRPATKKDTK